MALWEAWSTNPNDNDDPPPVGAPEGMKAGRNNDCIRQVMAACRELGDLIVANDNALGTIAVQDANAVAITGGSIAGNGAGITAMNADQLATGRVPNGRLTGSYDIDITGTAAHAAALTGTALDAVLPPGSIILWYGNAASIPVGWKLCDGSLGTPNMVGAVPIGAHTVNDPVGTRHGTGAITVAAVAGHTHAAAAAAVALTIAQMPLHGHPARLNPRNNNNLTGGLDIQSNTGGTPPQSNFPSYTGVPDDTLGHQIGGEGGGQTHTHTVTVTADAGHTHTATVDTVRVGLHFLMRA